MSQDDQIAVNETTYPEDDDYLPYTDDDSEATAAAYEPEPEIEQPRALTVTPPQQPQQVQQVQPSFTQRQLDLIKTTLAPGISDDQLQLFAMVAERAGLDPFQRQIYAVLRNSKERVNGKESWVKKMTIQTGIDGYLAIAERSGELAGVDDIMFDVEDGDHPNRATATVWRWSNGQRVPFSYTARWREYVQTDRDGKPTSMWARMPWTMLGKCALARALREGFPARLSGIYTSEEMMQADSALLTGEIVESDPPSVSASVTSAPATRPAAATSAAPHSRTAVPSPVPGPVEWNPLGDSPFRRRCNVVGVKSIGDVEHMLKEAGALTDKEGWYRKDKALAYLVNLEAMHAEAASQARKAVAR